MAFVKKTAVPLTGTAVKKKPAAAVKPAAPAKIVFDAPSDMKPCFVEFLFRTQDDGLIGPSFRCTRVQGNWTNPNAKRFDMMTYDAPTVCAVVSRVAGRTFAPNPIKRLPANSAFKIVIRAGVRKADDTILSGIKSISKLVKSAKTGKSSWKELVDTTDPVRRKIRQCARLMPGAFVNMQLPPSTGRSKKGDEASED